MEAQPDGEMHKTKRVLYVFLPGKTDCLKHLKKSSLVSVGAYPEMVNQLNSQ